jgi:HSP20 family protein
MALPTRVNRSQQYYDPAEAAQREFDTVLNRFFGGSYVGGPEGGALAPYGVDVRENGDHLVVEAELPGFKKDDVDITLENQTLTITAQKREETPAPQQAGGQQGKQQDRGNYLLRERRYSRFQRSFTLPDTVDDQSVDAKLQDGVLTITLNKRPETKPRKIQVS